MKQIYQQQQKQQYVKVTKEQFDSIQEELREFGIEIIPERSAEISRCISIESNKDLKVIPVFNTNTNSQTFIRSQLKVLEKYNCKYDDPSRLVYFVIERQRTGIF